MDEQAEIASLEMQNTKLKEEHEKSLNKLQQLDKRQKVLQGLLDSLQISKMKLTKQLDIIVLENTQMKSDNKIKYFESLENIRHQISLLQEPLNNEKLQYDLIQKRRKITEGKWGDMKSELSCNTNQTRYAVSLTKAKISEVQNRITVLKDFLSKTNPAYSNFENISTNIIDYNNICTKRDEYKKELAEACRDLQKKKEILQFKSQKNNFV
ncbi:hypothetical protein TRFO_10286 [Tritrichomonas foetus]|uniref:Uncharacterized protein n=1 Tax=Tritrichomonas foetus TaxID=1144522 RepID=A0A1J4JF51_9EUKA|nr:hypothetical protein TRFO_10286 [Tritrichomonas foetus]|eukprot:OHS95876.1 hypothetical protein TRFO_10286 [Tritrichomonas foetus]